MAKQYPNKQITWIYPEENKPIGVGEALIPDVSHFLNDLGISHTDVIKHCNGTLKIGIKFDGFNKDGETFTFPFGVGEGDKHNSSSLDRIMLTDQIPDDILEYNDISVHFRAFELLKYMDTLVSSIPNITIQRKSVTLDELAGTYDLVIDSTGFGRRISNWDDNFISLKDKIPNNCALVFRHPYTNKAEQCKPYSIFKAMPHGWIWNIPLGDQLAIGYVHCDKYDVKADFVKYAEQKFNIKVDDASIGRVPMITGRNKVHIKDNVVAIGLASAFIEPIESTGLYLVTSALKRLREYIDGNIEQADYNQLTNDEFDSVTNFILAHYKYSNRNSEYWQHYKTVEVEDNKEIDIFPSQAWDYVLSGFRDDVKRPVDKVNPQELINIHRGQLYHEWLSNARNAT